ncbi:MAG: M-phase inducer phosphatase [Amphiamblys sp. WSBS2006]|nr:MAG: M-phase inducer phosphatase [Amphiamblys sp. WSBS2006]
MELSSDLFTDDFFVPLSGGLSSPTLFRRHLKNNKQTENTEMEPRHAETDTHGILFTSIADTIPHYSHPHDAINRITPQTLCKLLCGEFVEDRPVLVVDCRYSYEYEGGHIQDAQNISAISDMEKSLFSSVERNTVVVFYCEYSVSRAPAMALAARGKDRQLNRGRYPALHYGDLFVLGGGYCSFFAAAPTLCTPQQYTQMDDAAYCDRLREERAEKKRKDFSRKRIIKSF